MMTKLSKAYQYLFYKFYVWDLWLHGKSDLPHQVAWFTSPFLVWMNFLTVLVVLEIFTGYGFKQIAQLSQLNILAIVAIFLVLNYFLFVYKKSI